MKKWNLKPSCQKEAGLLSQELGISNLTAQLLINRRIQDPLAAKNFLFNSLKDLPNPFLMKDMEKGVERIISAIKKKEKIVIYGDYDVDGTAGTSILILFFKEIGYPVDFYIPHRLKEGYSLNEVALAKIKALGAKVVVTVDNGITANREAIKAKDLQIDLIITDHHEVPENIPEAYAVIDPLRRDCSFPAKEICGAGVAYYLVMALRQRLRECGFFEKRKEPNLKNYLDLVALATVADVVPLVGVNRIFTKVGLAQITRSIWPGIRALMNVSGLTGELAAYHLGFVLGPRLNACGRLYNATMGVKLLISEDEAFALEMAYELEKANRERRGIEGKIFDEAVGILEKDLQSSQRMSHVLYHKNWHPGVIGIVASKLAERFCHPVILFGKPPHPESPLWRQEDEWEDKKSYSLTKSHTEGWGGKDRDHLKGSARSYGGLNLVEVLGECKNSLIKFGGHKAAAGLSISLEKLQEFKDNFENEVKKKLSPENCVPHINIDSELSLKEINLKLMDEIKLLEPYGEGNPEPLLCLRGVSPQRERIVGEKHLKFYVVGTEAIAFGMKDRSKTLKKEIDLAFALKLNTYQGVSSLVLNVKDLKPSS